MSYYGFKPYESAADKKAKAVKKLKQLQKKNSDLEPISIEGNTIAKKWWGKSWVKHLESYADYANRISRGKAYVKQGAIFDLKISPGDIKALVNGSGSKIYEVHIKVDTLPKKQWEEIVSLCQNSVESLQALSEGKFSKSLEGLFNDPQYRLFPSPKEIHFNCSCPDYASMCKHVACVLYGFGSKLDLDPLLFFKLRDVNIEDLLKKTVDDKIESMLKNAGKKTKRTLNDNAIKDLFQV
ncbi:MAG: hypothetical protein JXR88_00620 [Clostridia bacterium]|nr:hypothetical protein [Clostridia bacterium]